MTLSFIANVSEKSQTKNITCWNLIICINISTFSEKWVGLFPVLNGDERNQKQKQKKKRKERKHVSVFIEL